MFNCGLCGSDEGEVFSRRDAKSGEALGFALCRSCGLVQQLDIPSDEALKVYYSHNYRDDYKKTLVPRRKYVHRAGETALKRLALLRRVIAEPRGQVLLDVGAGGGEFVYLAGKAGFDAWGVEPNVGYSGFARQHYGVRVETLMLDELEDASADVITLFHVFEHMARPVEVMRRLAAALTDDGLLFVEVPNIHQADASPHNIFFRAHLYYYSRHTLEAAASRFFDTVLVNDDGNLSMLLRKKRAPATACTLPGPAAVALTGRRLKEKGWFEYLLAGGGLLKPFRKLARIIREALLPRIAARDILDRLHRPPARRRAWPAIVGALLAAKGAYLVMAD